MTAAKENDLAERQSEDAYVAIGKRSTPALVNAAGATGENRTEASVSPSAANCHCLLLNWQLKP